MTAPTDDRTQISREPSPASPRAEGEWQLVPKNDVPDDALQFLSRLGHGFNVGERIASGREVYKRLLAMLPAPPVIAEHSTEVKS